jgi:photosystem II stability/assembly factor-like uncharacterized protein
MDWFSPSRHRRVIFISFSALAFITFFVAALAFAQENPSQLFHGLSWRLIGPFRGGRVTAVAGIAGDPKTYYMGTPGGGIWKTTDAGATWRPIFDDAHVASIGDLVVAPSNPNILYAATGEQSPGNGVWKSTDAGATWKNIGIRDSRTIPSLLVDPHDASIVYVAAVGDVTPGNNRSIYKTTDGGNSWRKVFFQDDHTSPTELCFDSSNSRTIYAVIRQLQPAPGEKSAEGLDTSILKSTDAGETWAPLPDKGLPPLKRGRIGLAVAAGLSGQRIFALMHQGLFRSDDAGQSWQQITKDPRVVGSEYFGRVFSDTKNPDVVYVMQTTTYHSSDGGRTFSAWKGTPSGEDDHVLWIAPEDPQRILMGTDQGAVITLDDGKSWNTWFNQPTGQFYRVSTDNDFPYHLYAPQQDSGSVVVPNRSDFGLITYREWYSSGAFESGFIAPDPLNPNFVYSIGWYGVVLRLDRSTGQVATLFVPPSNYKAVWETPLVFAPRDPHRLYFGSQFLMKTTDGGLTWKEISGDLAHKSVMSPSKLQEMSRGHIPSKDDGEDTLFEDEDSAQRPPPAAIQSIAPSPLDTNLIWIGTASGLIQVTHDGTSWTDVTPPGLAPRSSINVIEPSPFDPKEAYAVIITRRDSHPYIFRTRDGGQSWQKIVAGLPEDAVARVVREDPVRKGLLFAGTETGVYLSTDSGDTWKPFQLNLPAASVRDLAIHGADLIAATFGRGLWILDDISPLRQAPESLWKAASGIPPAQFFSPEPAIRVRWDNHPDTPLQPDIPAAQNPPDGATFYYFLGSAPKQEITIDVLDEKGARIRHFSSNPIPENSLPANVPEFWFAPPASLPAQPGINRFTWNLRYPDPPVIPYSYFGERLDYIEYDLPDNAIPGKTPRLQPPGPLAAPGAYTLVLTVDGKSYNQKLQVVPDPRVHIPAADFAAQRDFSLKICAWMAAAANSFRISADLDSQLDARRELLPADAPKELTGALNEVHKQLDAIEDGTNDAPGFGAVSRDLGRYLVMVQSGDLRPTESARNAALAACNAYAKDLADWDKLNSEAIPALNKLLAAQKIEPMHFASAASPMPACAP